MARRLSVAPGESEDYPEAQSECLGPGFEFQQDFSKMSQVSARLLQPSKIICR